MTQRRFVDFWKNFIFFNFFQFFVPISDNANPMEKNGQQKLTKIHKDEQHWTSDFFNKDPLQPSFPAKKLADSPHRTFSKTVPVSFQVGAIILRRLKKLIKLVTETLFTNFCMKLVILYHFLNFENCQISFSLSNSKSA